MKRLIEFFTSNTLFGNLLTLFTICVGIAAVFLIRREVFPNVSYDVITVTTVFPGAPAEEVEQVVTNPLEQDLKEIDGIKRISSHSVEGRSAIVIQLDPDQTNEEKAKSDIRDIVDRYKPDLPEGAEEPIIDALESKQQPIIEVAVAGDLPPMELRTEAKRIKDELEDIPGVARVNPVGLRDLEIRVETDLEKLRRYQLSLDDVITALKGTNVSIPGGTIEVSAKTPDKPERTVRTSGRFAGPKDVGETVVRANDLGRAIRVSDIAQVYYDLEEPSVIDHTNGKRSIRLTVLKKEKADAITVVDAVMDTMERLKPSLKEGVQIEFVNDLSTIIRRRLSILSSNLAVGLLLVAVVLSLLLPIRVALIVSLGIPFSFFGTMILFNAWDYSINLISMIGLIIVSGMLVDDAIVVTDNCVRKMEEGMAPREAASRGTHEIWVPVTASVMTTVVVFLPMMFMSGIFGKFVKQIPLGVVIALLISLCEAFFVLPTHIAEWVRLKKATPKGSDTPEHQMGVLTRFWDKYIDPIYLKVIRFNLRHRYAVFGASILFLIGTFGVAGVFMRFVLFPADDVEIFMIRAEAPVGTPLERTEELMKPIEDAVNALPDGELNNFLTTIGMHFKDIETLRRGSEVAQATVFLTPPNVRDRGDDEIIADLRKAIGTPPGLTRVTFERVNPGPPVGRPIDLGVRAKEYEQILPAVAYLKEILRGIKGVTDVQDDYLKGKETVTIRVLPSEAAAANVSVAEIGTTVRASFEGIVATTIPGLDEEIDVRVSLPKEARTNGDTLEEIRIPNRLQNLIPLSRVTTRSTSQDLAEYGHEDFERQVKVTAGVEADVTTAQEVNGAVRARIAEIESKFPGITIAFGGEDQDTQESMASLGRAFIVALLGILLILVLTFKNLLHPFLVFSTIPFGLAAIVWAFLLHGKPLTFMGMLGAIALAGVIVNNSIVFIDFMNQRRKEGASKYDSIVDTAKARLRPIFLTSFTTAVGVLPTTYGIGGLDRFVVYIAMALSWGLLFGSFFISLYLPTALAVVDDVAEWVQRRFARPKPAAIPGDR